MEGGPYYDCQRCGACCIDPEGGEGYAHLSRDESKRMRRLGLRVVAGIGGRFLGTRARPAGGGWACVPFRGEVGGPCACSAYADRPAVCRLYEAGGLECRRARAGAGVPV